MTPSDAKSLQRSEGVEYVQADEPDITGDRVKSKNKYKVSKMPDTTNGVSRNKQRMSSTVKGVDLKSAPPKGAGKKGKLT